MRRTVHVERIGEIREDPGFFGDDDVEAASARMKWWQAILFGPCFYVTIQWRGRALEMTSETPVRPSR